MGILFFPKLSKLGLFLALTILLCSIPICAIAQSPSDRRDDFPPIFTVSPKGVNLQTGRFTYSKTDLSIGGLSFIRTFGGPRVPLVGLKGVPDNNARKGWTHNFAHGTYTSSQSGLGSPSLLIHFVVLGQTYSYFAFLGTPVTFGNFVSADALGSTVSVIGKDFRLETKNGDVFYFYKHPALRQLSGDTTASLIQVLRRAEYADGSSLDYSYNSSGQPKTVINNRGFAIVMDYNVAGSISNVCGYNLTVKYVNSSTTCAGATLKVSYEYNSIPSLSRVIDVSGQSVTINYISGSISCISLVNSSNCEISNVSGPLPGEPAGITRPDQVRRQTTATGDVWNYFYDPNNIYDGPDVPPTPREPRITYSTMTDPDGYETVGTYLNGFVSLIEAPQGSTRYEFNGTVPMKLTYPAGNSTIYNRDGFQNLTSRVTMPVPGTSHVPLTVTQTFPQLFGETPFPNGCDAPSRKLCTKPITRVDERGNQTDFTYAAAHGGILTETGPAVNGIRPQTRYTYTQRYAWVRNASNVFIRATTPVWVLTQKSYCKAGAASGVGCAIAGDEVKTTYDYGPDSGPNNLLLRGQVDDAGGLNLRTCYSYDWRGNKVSTTPARAALGVCS
jgi:hypothetical protein